MSSPTGTCPSILCLSDEYTLNECEYHRAKKYQPSFNGLILFTIIAFVISISLIIYVVYSLYKRHPKKSKNIPILLS